MSEGRLRFLTLLLNLTLEVCSFSVIIIIIIIIIVFNNNNNSNNNNNNNNKMGY